MSVHAERIRERRKQLRISQEDLADVLGTTQSQISRYEKGENDPTGEILAALASALETSADWLLGLTDDVARPVTSKSDLSEDEKQLLEIYRRKSPEVRRKVLDVARVL